MIGFDICRILSYDSLAYKNLTGLFHMNELPSTVETHKFLIVFDSNHWGVVHCNLLKQLELFDPLGQNSPLSKKVTKHFKTEQTFTSNKTQLQSNESTLCGEYAIYYICMRFYDDGINYIEFLKLYFSTNQEKIRNELKNLLKN